MLDKILRLGKDTATYGLSTVLGRLLNFLIVPLYANTLLPAENGVIANIYAYIAFAAVLYGAGMEQAFMRFYTHPEIGGKKENFTVPFAIVCGGSFILSGLLLLNAGAAAQLIGLPVSSARFVRYAAGILFFDAVAIVPFVLLRMERRARRFASLKFLTIAVTLALNILLIVVLRWGIEGVFAANLAASVLGVVMLFREIRSGIQFPLPKKLPVEFLRFGLPLIPAGLAGTALQVIDRPIVRALTSDASLGVYQINYRLGIFMMLVVGMFDYAWRPFFLAHAKEPDAKPLFVRVFTILLLGLGSVLVLATLFIPDLVRLQLFGHQFFPPVYWTGLEIVPWVLLAYVFTGMYTSFVVGVYLEKQTRYIPLISGAAAMINVAANFLLIPKFGILGAAWATTIAYAVMAGAMFRVSQRYYPIAYEWGRIVRIAVAGAVVLAANALWSPPAGSAEGLVMKSGLALCYVIALMLLGVVSRAEISIVFRLLSTRASSVR